MICAWCETDLREADRPIRLSTTQPPVRTASVISAIAGGFAAVIAATHSEPPITVYFHPHCWRELAALLPGYRL